MLLILKITLNINGKLKMEHLIGQEKALHLMKQKYWHMREKIYIILKSHQEMLNKINRHNIMRVMLLKHMNKLEGINKILAGKVTTDLDTDGKIQTLEGKTITLGNDITQTSGYFGFLNDKQTATLPTTFNGVIDGNNYCITMRSRQNGFVQTLNGTIKNLNVNITNDTPTGVRNEAGIALINNGTIENCKGVITPSYSSTNLTINGCYNLGEIDGLNDSIKPGGIAGNLDTNATIKNCNISTKGALVPKTGIIVENSYHWYLPTTSYPSSDEDYGYDTDMKTQTFCDKLNSSSTTEPIYKMIKEQEFPALYWQEGTSK